MQQGQDLGSGLDWVLYLCAGAGDIFSFSFSFGDLVVVLGLGMLVWRRSPRDSEPVIGIGVFSFISRVGRKREADGKGELVGAEEPAFGLRVAGAVRVGGGEEGGWWRWRRGGLLRLRRGESREDERRRGGVVELDAPDEGKCAGEERQEVRD